MSVCNLRWLALKKPAPFRQSSGSVAPLPVQVTTDELSFKRGHLYSEFGTDRFRVESESSAPDASFPGFEMANIWTIVTVIWFLAAVCGVFKLSWQMHRLNRLRQNANTIRSPALNDAILLISRRMHFSRRVQLLQSSEIAGPITAGFRRPFILLPADLEWNAQQSDSERHTTQAETQAVLAHELAHIPQC